MPVECTRSRAERRHEETITSNRAQHICVWHFFVRLCGADCKVSVQPASAIANTKLYTKITAFSAIRVPPFAHIFTVVARPLCSRQRQRENVRTLSGNTPLQARSPTARKKKCVPVYNFAQLGANLKFIRDALSRARLGVECGMRTHYDIIVIFALIAVL